jgi:hypothetical protein
MNGEAPGSVLTTDMSLPERQADNAIAASTAIRLDDPSVRDLKTDTGSVIGPPRYPIS